MADSMTQSMASVSSLARDFSWEQLHTDTEREVVMIMVIMVMVMVMIVTTVTALDSASLPKQTLSR